MTDYIVERPDLPPTDTGSSGDSGTSQVSDRPLSDSKELDSLIPRRNLIQKRIFFATLIKAPQT